MKKYQFFNLTLLINGCQASGEQSKSSSANSNCPSQPKVALSSSNVEEITLTPENIIKAVTAGSSQPFGYRFSGKKEQKLAYASNDNLCFWLYSSDLKVLNDTILPEDGNYILQIAPTEGSGTFQLKISLSSNRPSPAQAITDHYRAINEGKLDESWSDLTTEFKGANLEKGKREYDQWWNTVQKIEVGEVTTESSSDNLVILEVGLTYTLKGGRVFRDPRNKIKLTWNKESKKWLIDGKYQ
jgi:hypothetical protein